jgi:uncharacterized protein (TIGR02594 family)
VKQKTPSSEPVWLEVARSQLGVTEAKNPGTVVGYHQATRLRAQSAKTPWCASFVSWCLEKVGLPNPRTARARDFATYGVATYAEPGCIIVLDKMATDAGGSGHVAFLVGVEGADLLLLGGNQSNSVCIKRYPAERAIAYRWPPSP